MIKASCSQCKLPQWSVNFGTHISSWNLRSELAESEDPQFKLLHLILAKSHHGNVGKHNFNEACFSSFIEILKNQLHKSVLVTCLEVSRSAASDWLEFGRSWYKQVFETASRIGFKSCSEVTTHIIAIPCTVHFNKVQCSYLIIYLCCLFTFVDFVCGVAGKNSFFFSFNFLQFRST